MRALRTFLGWLITLQLILMFASCAGIGGSLGLDSPVLSGLFSALGGVLLFYLPYTLAVRRILPKRTVDILYLRAFKYDRETAIIRYDIHKIIGLRPRVSGIRDPRRRWPRIIRFAFLFSFALRYSTPRYLNLEAGDDWKARLWRSLTLAKGALIDVSDMTTFVVAEMLLCYRNMGLNRVLFIGDGSKSINQWSELINTTLGRSASDPGVQVAIWEDNRGDRRRFQEALKAFVVALPGTEAGYKNTVNELQRLSREYLETTTKRPHRLWVEILIGFCIGIVLTITQSGLSLFAKILDFSILGYVLSTISIAMSAITLWHMGIYLKDCGSHRERILTTVTFGSAVTLPFAFVAAMLPAVEQIKDAAVRSSSMNNLKQIAIAMHNYNSEFGHLPGANTSITDRIPDVGHPAVSWRVKLLPYLFDSGDPEEAAKIKAVIRGYRTNEPWNSINNRQFIEMMPKFYRFPGDRNNAPPGYTHYRVFVTPRDTLGPTALFRDGLPGPRIFEIPDGASNTILVAEAAEPVIWTDPTDLVFTHTRALPKFGGYYRRGVYLVVRADGSVRVYRENMPDFELRARITANGGEAVNDD